MIIALLSIEDDEDIEIVVPIATPQEPPMNPIPVASLESEEAPKKAVKGKKVTPHGNIGKKNSTNVVTVILTPMKAMVPHNKTPTTMETLNGKVTQPQPAIAIDNLNTADTQGNGTQDEAQNGMAIETQILTMGGDTSRGSRENQDVANDGWLANAQDEDLPLDTIREDLMMKEPDDLADFTPFDPKVARGLNE
ncbi:unnamed protein product [Calypogeia fissa]